MPGKRRSSRSRHPRGRISKRVRRYVSKKIAANQETKQRLLTYDQQSIQDGGRTPVSTGLTAVTQGMSQNERIGNEIRVTGLFAKFFFVAADTTNAIRFIIYRPRDPTDTLSNAEVYSLIDQDAYDIVLDKLITVSTNGPGVVSRTFALNFHRGAKNGMRFHFTGSTNTSYGNSPLRLYVVSDSQATGDPTMTGNVRVYFKDG